MQEKKNSITYDVSIMELQLTAKHVFSILSLTLPTSVTLKQIADTVLFNFN